VKKTGMGEYSASKHEPGYSGVGVREGTKYVRVVSKKKKKDSGVLNSCQGKRLGSWFKGIGGIGVIRRRT